MQLTKWQVVMRLLLAGGMGVVFATNCTGVAEKVFNNVNPCGTVLNCDPLEYELLNNNYPDWSWDPTCTIPGQCGTWPPNSTTSGTTTP